MTDVSTAGVSLPGRLGVTARFDDGQLTLDLNPQRETLHHQVVRASVLAFVIDAVAGISVDEDEDAWTFTTDLSVRMRPLAAPPRISAVNRVLRQGRRSVACAVELTDQDGAPVATGAAGFARVPRREDDPEKVLVRPEDAPAVFQGRAGLDRPLREEAGIEVVDAAAGVVQVEVTEALRNPAGTLQGAMVALVAEAAAEDLVRACFGVPAVVTDLDIRYLAQARVGPVRTRTRLLGDGPESPLEVALVDTASDRLATLVYARAAVLEPSH